jgi:hypothetical protein
MQEVYGDPRRGDGYYVVEAANLVASCEHYDPYGILIWIPKEKMFATWDCDHHLIKVLMTRRVRNDQSLIEAVTWTDIASDPVRFINSQWTHDCTTSKLLIPWPKYPWKPQRSR